MQSPERAGHILRAILSMDDKFHSRVLSAVNTALLANKTDWAAEDEADKVLQGLESAAQNGQVAGSTRNLATKACREIVNRSDCAWLVQRARNVLQILGGPRGTAPAPPPTASTASTGETPADYQGGEASQ